MSAAPPTLTGAAVLGGGAQCSESAIYNFCSLTLNIEHLPMQCPSCPRSLLLASPPLQDYMRLSNYPVLIISYEMFVRAYEVVKRMTFDLIVCDEGHRLKNTAIKTTSVRTFSFCVLQLALYIMYQAVCTIYTEGVSVCVVNVTTASLELWPFGVCAHCSTVEHTHGDVLCCCVYSSSAVCQQGRGLFSLEHQFRWAVLSWHTPVLSCFVAAVLRSCKSNNGKQVLCSTSTWPSQSEPCTHKHAHTHTLG